MQKGIANLFLIIALVGIILVGLLTYLLFPYGIDLLKDNTLNILTGKNQIDLTWQYPIKGKLVRKLLVYNDKLYLTTNEGILYALDQATGKVVWTYEYGEKLDSNTEKVSSILADDNTIFIEATFYNPYSNNFIAVNSETGQEKWIKKFSNTIGPITSKEKISIIMERVDWNNQYLKAFDNSNGTEIWSYPLGGQSYFHLSIQKGVVYLFHTKSYPDDIALEAIDLLTGNFKWVYQLDGRDESFSPFKVGNLVVFGDVKDNDHFIKAFDASTGTLHWTSKSDILFKKPELWENSLIFKRTFKNGKTKSNFVVAVDAITGNDKWIFPISKSGNNDLIIDQGKAYFSDDKYLYSVDANTGKQVWKNTATGNADPEPILVSGNLLFYRDWKAISFESIAHFIHALDIKNGRAVWSWKDPAYQIEKGGKNLVYFESNGTIYALQPK